MALENTKHLVERPGSHSLVTSTINPSEIGSNEIMIRIKAIALSPGDCNMVDYGQKVSSWPLVPGLDGSGVVEAVGDMAGTFTVGDRVLAQFAPGGRSGSFQNLAVVSETRVARIPKTWTFEEAATLGVCYFTSVLVLGLGLKTPLPFVTAGPETGFMPSSALILDGDSAIGASIIQLLRLAVPDCSILATSLHEDHVHAISALGADRVFNRNSESWVEDVRLAIPRSRGVDVIIDAVGAGGRQRHIFDAFYSDGPKKYAPVGTNDLAFVPIGVDSATFTGRDLPELQGGQNLMPALQRLMEEGRYKLPLPVDKVGDGLGALETALELMRRGTSGRRLVVAV